MTRRSQEGDPELIQIAAAHPDWKPWRSRLDDGGPGSYYATRMDRELTLEEISDGWVNTIAADSPEQLVRLIEAQAAMDAP